jgi:4-hydroxybenzoate polyprenyltransferase
MRRNPDGTYPAWLAVLKISKVPFWFIWITPILFAYVSSAQAASARYLPLFVVAVVGTCLLEASTCIHNELVDQEEDRLNQPAREILVRSVGERRLWILVWLGYAICFLGLIPLALLIGPVVPALMLIGGLAGPLYNWGPRFKRRPFLAEVVIAWAFFLGYMWGWQWNAPGAEVPAVAWVVTYFFGITAILKDLPDTRGDEQVHAASIFSITSRPLHLAAVLFVYASPYLLLVGLVAEGILPPRFLTACLLILPAAAVLWLGERAEGLGAIVVYEFAFFYVHVFFLLLFVLDNPIPLTLMLAASLFIVRTLAVYLGLAPRFVEAEFSWSKAIGEIVRRPAANTT